MVFECPVFFYLEVFCSKTLLRKSKRLFEMGIAQRSKSNPKAFWSHCRRKLKTKCSVAPLFANIKDKDSLRFNYEEKANFLHAREEMERLQIVWAWWGAFMYATWISRYHCWANSFFISLDIWAQNPADRRLLGKLNAFGVQGILFNWIK